MVTITKYPYYEVHFLKLGDADSIILAYKATEFSSLRIALVDAGNVNDPDTIQSEIYNRWRRKDVDIAVLTHPDKDHKGGFFNLLQSDDFKIKQFWLCEPWVKHVERESLFHPIEYPSYAASKFIYNHPEDDKLNLLDLLNDKGVDVVDVYQGYQSDIMPLSVVGPTLDFADRNASIMVSNFKEVADDEILEMYVDNAEVDEEKIKSVIDSEPDDTSATNMSSLILMFHPNRKFLLTGDASRASLKAMLIEDIGLFQNCVLKVPHHGSQHNLDTELIDLLKPEQSAICAKGTVKHPNNSVVYWLSKYGNVYCTNKNGFYYTSEPITHPATPLKNKKE